MKGASFFRGGAKLEEWIARNWPESNQSCSRRLCDALNQLLFRFQELHFPSNSGRVSGASRFSAIGA